VPKPSSINGSQFKSRVFDLWAYANGVILDFSRPGNPTYNAFVESRNARIRRNRRCCDLMRRMVRKSRSRMRPCHDQNTADD
jgi:transposase InsO family protein